MFTASNNRENMIEVKSLTKNYGPVTALNSVSFRVKQGEIVGFLGPNGAGKTTLMKILTCYMSATSGTAEIAGHDVYESSMEVRKAVGYLPENVPLYLDMAVYDYLKFISGMRKLSTAKGNQKIEELSITCGLRPVMHRVIGQLSKGFRQRVGLAQAMIHDPQVLILDEPISGLDPRQIIEIRDLIREIGKKKTVIFSTHILQEIPDTCDRILIINNGSLVADGSLEHLRELLRKPDRLSLTIRTEEPPENIISLIEEIQGIRQVDYQKTDNPEISKTLFIEHNGALMVLENLNTLMHKKGYLITSMHSREPSIEELFLEMTGTQSEEFKRTGLSIKKRAKRDLKATEPDGTDLLDALDAHLDKLPPDETDSD